jgi:hypothetical protein
VYTLSRLSASKTSGPASLEHPLPHDGAANSRGANITSHEGEATPFRAWHATPPAAGLSLIPPIHVRRVREKRARLPISSPEETPGSGE